MEKVKVELEVTKEMHELMQGVVKIVAAAKLAFKDGFQAGQDVPAILIAAVAELPAMVGGLTELPAEAKEETGAFVAACSHGVSCLVQEILKK